MTALKYTAYGELRSGTSTTDYQYTGQRSEIEIGLYFYVARMYDPQLARFISADTIVPQPSSSQGYDRYAYVNNNPISFNDPSGHRFTECGLDGQGCGGPGSSSGSGGSNGGGSTSGGNNSSSPNEGFPPPVTGNDLPDMTDQSWNKFLTPMAPTPTTGLFWGPQPTQTPSQDFPTLPQPSRINISIDWDQVDYFDFSIDVLGIAGDVALIFVEPGPGVIIEIAVTAIEAVGAGKTIAEVYNNDYSSVKPFTVDTVMGLIGENRLVQFRLGRLVPIFGAAGSGYSLIYNLNPIITIGE